MLGLVNHVSKNGPWLLFMRSVFNEQCLTLVSTYWYIFPSKCAWKACFPIMLAQIEIPASGSMHPSPPHHHHHHHHHTHTHTHTHPTHPPPPPPPPPPREKTKSNRGDPALHLHQAKGHLNWRMGLPALLGGNLGCWIVWFPLILHSLWGMS